MYHHHFHLTVLSLTWLKANSSTIKSTTLTKPAPVIVSVNAADSFLVCLKVNVCKTHQWTGLSSWAKWVSFAVIDLTWRTQRWTPPVHQVVLLTEKLCVLLESSWTVPKPLSNSGLAERLYANASYSSIWSDFEECEASTVRVFISGPPEMAPSL